MRILMMLVPEIDPRDGKGSLTVRVERAAGPYYAFRDAGAEVVLASTDGGAPPLEMASHRDGQTGAVLRFKEDRAAIDEFSDTLSLDQVFADDFDGAFCVGLPGSIWYSESEHSAGALISRLLAAGKPVAVVPGGFEMAPNGAGEGLLIIGDDQGSTIPIAQTLISAVIHLRTKSERSEP